MMQQMSLQLEKQEQQMRERVRGESLVEQQKVQRLRRALYTVRIFTRSSKQARFKVQRGLQRHLRSGEHADNETPTFTGKWFQHSDGRRVRVMTTVSLQIDKLALEWSTTKQLHLAVQQWTVWRANRSRLAAQSQAEIRPR